MKKILLTLTVMLVAISLASCGGATTPEIEVSGDSPAAVAASLNNQLAPIVISGFAYGSSRVDLNSVKLIANQLTTVQAAVPEGYILAIYGHNDSYEGNSSVGVRRAQAVFYELRGLEMGLTDVNGRTNVYSKNARDDEMLEDSDPADPSQRRVTFMVVER
jgi:hypothetical protein